jgi:hypothetical protein
MGILSFLFSDGKEGKIQALKSRIESYRLGIAVERDNMKRYRMQKAPKHYQESGKKKIEHFQKLIDRCRADITNLRRK